MSKAAFSVLLGLPVVLAQSNCCQALQNAGISHILYPNSTEYSDRTLSYWSVSAQLSPYCIVQPTDKDQVIAVVKTLKDESCASTQFAVRSGGHTVWAGSNNIENGVTIDLGLMKQVSLDKENSVASIEPGARWVNVYGALDPEGYTVPGGRAGTVGVPGFLTGGGNSFYTARKGFACDNVKNFEVVSMNGEIINANELENADLWQALKGGSANFGIVTRFDMFAFKAGNLWGGTATYNKSQTAKHIDAYVKWTDNVENYPDGSSIVFWSYVPALADIVILAAYEDTQGNEAPSGFDNFMAIPRIGDTLRLASHKELTDELEQEPDYRDTWFTLTFANDAEIFAKIVEINEAFVEEWKQTTSSLDFITQCMFQSIPTSFSKHSADRGGNMLGLDQLDQNVIMLLFNIAVKTAEEEAAASTLLFSYGKKMQEYAAEKNGLIDWQYLNYASPNQDPLGSYGFKNVEKMRAVAKKYDPEGIFQTKFPGGFKISKVAASSYYSTDAGAFHGNEGSKNIANLSDAGIV